MTTSDTTSVSVPWSPDFMEMLNVTLISHLAKKSGDKVVGSDVLPKGRLLEIFPKDLSEKFGGAIKEAVSWMCKQPGSTVIYPDITGAGAGYRLAGFEAKQTVSAPTVKWLTSDKMTALSASMTQNVIDQKGVSLSYFVGQVCPAEASPADSDACELEMKKALEAGLFAGFTRKGSRVVVVKAETASAS